MIAVRWVLAGVLCALLGAPQARGQSLGDLTRDTADRADSLGPEPASWTVVAGEVVLGAVLGAAAGYATGLLGELVCDDCDASEPGGDTPGLIAGVPLGAAVGVWAVGRRAPPGGKLLDTALGAVIGTAVFVAFSELLEEQSQGARWSGVVFPAAVGAMGWNRSRAAGDLAPQPPRPMNRPRRQTGLNIEFALVQIRF